jgi:hypothetical protein
MNNKTSTLYLVTMLVAVLVLGSGCASQSYRVHVDAVHSEYIDQEAVSYRLLNANPERDADDLRVQQTAALVKTALSSKGFYEAPAGVAPEMEIEVDFDVEAPRKKVEHRRERTYLSEDGPIALPFLADGEREITVVVFVYEKYVRITARETCEQSGDRPPRELWSVVATNIDESDDLDRYVPMLVAAAMDEIAHDTGETRATSIASNDERVVFVREGM